MENLAFSYCGDLVPTGSFFLVWASVVALAIAWDAHIKFRPLLQTFWPDELDMLPALERRSHSWRTIGIVTSGLSIPCLPLGQA
jgi:hypothetical protein